VNNTKIKRLLDYLLVFGVLGILVLSSCIKQAKKPKIPQPESSAELEEVSGDRILFAVYSPNHFTLYVVNTNGTNLTKLMDFNTPDIWRFNHCLSPDKKHVAFFSPDYYLTILRIDSGDETKVIKTPGGYHLAWSPDSTKIAYISMGDLYVVNTDGSNNKKLAEHKSAYYHGISKKVSGFVHYPVWSADGKYILFDNFTAPEFLFSGSALDVRNRAIYSVNIEANEIQVLNHTAEILGPGPDKTKIVIKDHRKINESYTDQWLVMNDGGKICSEYKAVIGKWSPDGRTIANTLFDELYVLDSITLKHIEENKIEDVSNFIWSDDGQHIVYVSMNEILIVRHDLSHGFYVDVGLEYVDSEEEQNIELITWLSQK
jgi:hypothetical protein